jgi:hypothetical protein
VLKHSRVFTAADWRQAVLHRVRSIVVTQAGRASKPSFVIWLGESLGVHEAQQEARMSRVGARLSREVRQRGKDGKGRCEAGM